MNKAAAIAALAGAAGAQTCTNAFTKEALRVRDAAQRDLDLLGQETVALEGALQESEAAVQALLPARDAQQLLLAPFSQALQDAQAALTAQLLLTDGAAGGAAGADSLDASAQAALALAQGARDLQLAEVQRLQALEDAQAALEATLLAAREEHRLEQEAFLAAEGAADAAQLAADQARDGPLGTAVTDAEAAVAAQELVRAAAEALEPALESARAAAALTWQGLTDAFQLAQGLREAELVWRAEWQAVVDSADFQETRTNGARSFLAGVNPAEALLTAQGVALVAPDAAAATAALATEQAAWLLWATQRQETARAAAVKTELETAKTIADGELTAGTGLATTRGVEAQAARQQRVASDGELAVAEGDLGRQQPLTLAAAALTQGARDLLVVRDWQLGGAQAEADLRAQEKAAARAPVAALTAVRDLAQGTQERAEEMLTFHAAALALAEGPRDEDQAFLDANAAAVAAGTAMVASLTQDLAAETQQCKVEGYEYAQENARLRQERAAQDLQASAAVAASYALRADFPTGGLANTLCAYPPYDEATGQGPRPACGDGLCCGAAQKFLKDGTKLSLETCQTCEGTHTYQYWPPLPEGAVVEPLPETWRWQEISAAQHLAHGAAAVLAAGYLMM